MAVVVRQSLIDNKPLCGGVGIKDIPREILNEPVLWFERDAFETHTPEFACTFGRPRRHAVPCRGTGTPQRAIVTGLQVVVRHEVVHPIAWFKHNFRVAVKTVGSEPHSKAANPLNARTGACVGNELHKASQRN